MNTTATNTIKERLADLYEYVHRSLGFCRSKKWRFGCAEQRNYYWCAYVMGKRTKLLVIFWIPFAGLSAHYFLFFFYPFKLRVRKRKIKKDSKNLFSCENISLLSFEAFKSLISEKQEITFFETDKMEHIYHTGHSSLPKI